MVPRKNARNVQITLALIFYVALYFVLAWLAGIPSRSVMSFVRDEFKIRNNYVLIRLQAEDPGISTSVPGCEYCHIISHPDFMPLSEYDAVLAEESAPPDGRRHREKYILRPKSTCVSAKIEECRVLPANGTALLNLCSLCENLMMRRKPKPFYIIQ